MHFTDILFASFSLVAAARGQSSSAGQVKVYAVQVGANGELSFSPENVQANPGEMVQFQFNPKNHSVVQSSFGEPCSPINQVMSNVTGFKSGYMPVAAGATTVPVFTIMVNDTKPIWVYCSQKGHCQKGMVAAINAANTGPKSFAAYKALAMGQSSSSTNSSSGTGTASSPGSSSSSSASGTAAPTTVNTGIRPAVNGALLVGLLAVGSFFVAL